MTTDTTVNGLIINKLTKSQYNAALAADEISDTELYMITDEDYYNKNEVNGLLNTKLDGSSLKTINGESILGTGDITIEGGGGTTVEANKSSSGTNLTSLKIDNVDYVLNYLPLSGGTLTGHLLPNSSSVNIGSTSNYFGNVYAKYIQTGTDGGAYFQCQKFRGEGTASTYYHAIDFGYANHDYVSFYEYGGVWNFWKNMSSTPQETDSNRALTITIDALKNKGYTYTWPNKTGTIALTSDITSGGALTNSGVTTGDSTWYSLLTLKSSDETKANITNAYHADLYVNAVTDSDGDKQYTLSADGDSDSYLKLGSADDKILNIYAFKLNNGGDIVIPSKSGTMALLSDVTSEIAKVVASAPESFDTLKEIADWISNDTTGAAKMASDISSLQTDKQDVLTSESEIEVNSVSINGEGSHSGLYSDGLEVTVEDDGNSTTTLYSATNITISNSEEDYVLDLPQKSGTIATLDDVGSSDLNISYEDTLPDDAEEGQIVIVPASELDSELEIVGEGNEGDVLTLQSDGTASWSAPSTGIELSGGSGNEGDVLTKQPDGTAAWVAPSNSGGGSDGGGSDGSGTELKEMICSGVDYFPSSLGYAVTGTISYPSDMTIKRQLLHITFIIKFAEGYSSYINIDAFYVSDSMYGRESGTLVSIGNTVYNIQLQPSPYYLKYEITQVCGNDDNSNSWISPVYMWYE